MAEDIAESEYSAQYFEFTPEMFHEQFCELFLDEMTSLFQQFMKTFAGMENEDELLKTAVKIHTLWTKRAEKILKPLLPEIKQFFTIPKNVLLESDSALVVHYSKQDIKKLQDELNELKVQYSEELRLKYLIQEELNMFEKLDPLKQKVDEGIEKLNEFAKAVKEAQELGEIAETLTDYKKLLEIYTDADDRYEFHKNKFQ